MTDLPTLEPWQYSLVFNFISFTFAGMAGAFVFFLGSSSRLGVSHRVPNILSAVIVGVAGYHYFQILGDWRAAYQLIDGQYVPSGVPFNDAYRYADWFLTVPLLVTELVLVLKRSARMAWTLSIAALAMIALGYPGERASSAGESMLWWTLSMIPFLFIVWILLTRFFGKLDDVPESVRGPAKMATGILILTWFFYPIAYLIAAFTDGAGSEMAVQIGYSLADITAKAVYGVLIFNVALAMTKHEEATGQSAHA